MLAKERALQEESEKRWVQLIYQARSETKNLHKKYEEDTCKQKDQIKELQNNLVKLQDSQTIAQTTLTHKNEIIDSQNKLLEKAQYDYTIAVSELAVVKSKLAGKNTIRKVGKKRLACV